jgi:HAD superfamily phosphatase (TIGR01668 family)
MDMPFSLLPTVMVRELTQLTPEFLSSRKIRLLMLDFDNTIIPYTTNTPTAEMDAWLKKMAASDIALCVVSNSKSGRVPAFCANYGIDFILRARKPSSRGIRRCMDKYGVPFSACALAGDQIFTDTLGANCAGLTSILVKPIDNHNIWLKLRHVAEKPFIILARKRRLQ